MSDICFNAKKKPFDKLYSKSNGEKLNMLLY